MKTFIKRFSEITLADIPLVGSKIAALGDLYGRKESGRILIPNGFALTTDAFREFLSYNKLAATLQEQMCSIRSNGYRDLELAGSNARALIMAAKIPPKVEDALGIAFNDYFGSGNHEVAVRSSVASEYDCRGSLVNQYESFLNIKGLLPLAYAIKCCYASLYTEHAIRRRIEQGYAHDRIFLSVGVQRMVRSDIGCSGITTLKENDFGEKDQIQIRGSWGLGEYIRKELLIPDQFTLSKTSLGDGGEPTIEKVLGSKNRMLVYHDHAAGTNSTMDKTTPRELRTTLILSDREVRQLAEWSIILEYYYGLPVDFEWAKDGIDLHFYLIGVIPQNGHQEAAGQNLRDLQQY